jgi:lipoprotein-releasing system permease protein
MPFETFIGGRHLRSTRSTFLSTLTLLAIIGVAMGVTALTSVVSVTGGFVESFRERVLGVNPHILIMKFGVYFSEYELVEEAVEAMDGVVSASPFIQHEMLVTSNTSRNRPGALVRGLDVDDLIADPELEPLIVEGSLQGLLYADQFADGQRPTDPALFPGAAVGSVLANRLNVEIGDSILLMSPLRGLSALGMDNNNEAAIYARVRVEAIVRSGFYDFDNRLVVVDYRALQDLFNRGDVVTGVEVRVTDVFATEDLMQRLDGVLTTGRYRQLDWREINHNLFTSLQLQKLYLSMVMTVLVVVASSVILCVLMMLVIEKRREIAILRSMGATAWSVMFIFIYEGLVIGALGTLLGLAGGWGVCLLLQQIDWGLNFEVYRIDELPVTINPVEFAIAGAGAMVICLLATLYPSWKASQVTPLDALRYD